MAGRDPDFRETSPGVNTEGYINQCHGPLTALRAVSATSCHMRPVTADVLDRKSKPKRLQSADWLCNYTSARQQFAKAHLTSMITDCNHGSATSLGTRFVLLSGKRKNVPFILRLNETISCDLFQISHHIHMIPSPPNVSTSGPATSDTSAFFYPQGKMEAALLLTVDHQAKSTFVALCLQESPPQCGNLRFVLRRAS